MDYQRLLDLTEKVLIVRGGRGLPRKGGITRIEVLPEGGSRALELKNWDDSTPADDILACEVATLLATGHTTAAQPAR